MSKKKASVIGIDLGYSSVKLAKADGDTDIETTSFPSIVTEAIASTKVAGLVVRDTFYVDHKNKKYEIGNDVLHNTDGMTSQALNNTYTQSNDYSVLMKGALIQANVDAVEMLVIGSPVEYFEELKLSLKNQWQGVIHLDDERQVNIKEVVVLPQPVGGFYYYAKSLNDWQKVINQRSLIIDIGFYTVDWVVLHDMKLGRSGGYPGGMSFYIKAIINALHKRYSLRLMKNIEKSLINKQPLNIHGKEHSLTAYLSAAESVIEVAVQQIMSGLNGDDEFDNIVVIGGAAEIYAPLIKAHYSEWDVKVVNDKVFANAIGYYLVGLNMLAGS